MGYNTSVIVLNDAISNIRKDKDFNQRFADAVSQKIMRDKPIDVSAGGHVNAVRIIETHHADIIRPIFVGGNIGNVIDNVHIYWNDNEPELTLLKQLANKLNYRIIRNGR